MSVAQGVTVAVVPQLPAPSQKYSEIDELSAAQVLAQTVVVG